jgi:hypothetical protein
LLAKFETPQAVCLVSAAPKFEAVLRIRMFLDFLDLDPDSLVRDADLDPDPAPDPSTIKQK